MRSNSRSRGRGVVRLATLLLAGVLLVSAARAGDTTRGRGLILAGEPVTFSRRHLPEFTPSQIENSVESTREGLASWALTAEGRGWIAKFRSGEYEVVVTENGPDDALGEAVEPGIAMLAAAADRNKVKRYTINLNPYVAADYTSERVRFAEIPSPDDAMALAWAGEMLHLSFFAAGIGLPHHVRPEFQRRWQAVASQLGFGRTKHVNASDAPR